MSTACTLLVPQRRRLSGVPLYTERCWYPAYLAEGILGIDVDCPSVTTAVYLPLGAVPASATHLIDLVAADEFDAELLGVQAGEVMLRRRGSMRQRDGSPVDYTEDRYIQGLVAFQFQNSQSSNNLSRLIQAGSK